MEFTAIEDYWRLEISELGSREISLSMYENKGADKLCGYCAALICPLNLCFPYAKSRSFHDTAQTGIVVSNETHLIYLILILELSLANTFNFGLINFDIVL